MPRARVTITLDEELLKWVNEYLVQHYEFKDRSHFIEVLIHRYKENVEKT